LTARNGGSVHLLGRRCKHPVGQVTGGHDLRMRIRRIDERAGRINWAGRIN
jgi:hypothetical protein